ncbi:hypothetical protein PC123_g14822 [Phytophthora cactorum]|nr:hypothetical protein PC123_g14822 [Phytophthora cactorum]
MCEGQPTKHAQPNKESGKNSPIGRNGGVVCSDLKGLMVPVERKGNQYMVKFVDHLINYGRVSVAKKKDKLQHQTVLNMTCRLRIDLTLHFWGDAAEYSVYILNRSPTAPTQTEFLLSRC